MAKNRYRFVIKIPGMVGFITGAGFSLEMPVYKNLEMLFAQCERPAETLHWPTGVRNRGKPSPWQARANRNPDPGARTMGPAVVRSLLAPKDYGGGGGP